MSGVDVGKEAKRAGRKRPRDARKEIPDSLHLPPHKKPRKWTLTIEWTETTTRRRVGEFTSRAARDEARRRIERYFKEQEENAKVKGRQRYWSSFWNSPLSSFSDEHTKTVKAGPEYTEGYEEGSAP